MKQAKLNIARKLIETFDLGRIIKTTLAILLSISGNAQIPIYKNFGVDEGLPSSEIYDMHQDQEGYIWFATDKGLSRYNGYEFENFSTIDGLTGNVVLKFYPQKNGQVWCYSYHNQSLFFFEEKFKGFTKFKYNKELHDVLDKTSIVKSVYVDKEDNVFIGGFRINGEIIIQKDGQLKQRYTSKGYYQDFSRRKIIVLKTLSDSVSSTSYFSTLDEEHANTQLFSSKELVSRILATWFIQNEIALFMDSKSVKMIFRNQESRIIKNKYSPLGINVVNEDQIFIGYEFGGGKIFDREGNIVEEYLSGQSVSDFLIDHEGGYWFTTLNAGVFYLKNPAVKVHNLDQAKYHEVNSIVKIKDDTLLVGYGNGAISKVYQNKNTLISKNPKTISHALVEYDPDLDKVYIFNENNLKENKSGNILTSYILKLSEPMDNNIFVAFDQGFNKIGAHNNIDSQYCSYRVHDVCLWRDAFLIATPFGLYRFQNNEYIPLSKESPLFHFRSDDIDVDTKNDLLYVATQGAGVVINDGHHTFNLMEEDGLSSNIVNEIHIENDSIFWACTNKGINRIIWRTNGLEISSMQKKDGILSNEVKDIEIINDTVWVGTKQGLCSFPKSQLNAKHVDLSNFQRTDVFVNNVSQTALTKPKFHYTENNVDILLEGISYAHHEDIYYQYRLNEKQNWSTTTNRTIHFSSLAPGSHLFEAKMCIDDQNCSEKTIRYTFTIQAPFWKRWWFISLCLLGVGLLIYTFFKVKVLTYNKDVVREVIRLLIKKLRKEEAYFSFRENGHQVRVKTEDIVYIKSAGNYIDLYTKDKTHTIRLNIGKFLDSVSDPLEYVRLHRSYIVRIDKIVAKSKSEVQLINNVKVPVSANYHKNLKEVVF